FTVFLTGTSSQPDVRGRLVDGEIVKYAEKRAGLKEIPDWIGWPLFLGLLIVAGFLATGMANIAFIVTNQIPFTVLVWIGTFIGMLIALVWGTERLLARYGFFLIRWTQK